MSSVMAGETSQHARRFPALAHGPCFGVEAPRHEPPPLDRADDGLDRPALPGVPPRPDGAGAALYRDGDRRRRCCTATASGCWASTRSSIRWRCSWAAPTRRSWPRPRGSAQAFGYDEINLNVGCPSDRVQSGRFGACLMREPALVAECMAAITAAVAVPATVKCRIGVDDQDPEVACSPLVDACAAGGRRRSSSSTPARPG